MMMMAHYENHHRPFPSNDDDPTGNNNRPKTGNIYDVLAGSDYGSVAGSGAVGVRILQPFEISPTSSSIAHTAFKSPGGMALAASLEFPFTFSQRKELETQIRIYKYMMASVPVPLDLLIPMAGSPSVPVASQSALGGGALNKRLGGRGDVEPGRCKRTDGKKWRCSRDVAPGQKYCERHLHRGRPRSRKPVELPNKRTRHTHTHAQALSSSSSTLLTKTASQPHFAATSAQAFQQNQIDCFLDKPGEKAATFWPRTSNWSTDELFPLADQQWNHLMQMGAATEGYLSNANDSFVLGQNYDKEPLDLISHPNFNAAEEEQRNSCPWFLNSEIVPLQEAAQGTSRGFIDAWSTGVSGDNTVAEASVSCNGKLSLSSLSLSMGPIRMGLGASEYDENHGFASKSHLSSWLAPGGPLAEVLRPSATKSSSNLSSPVTTGGGNSSSPPVTAMSSPSGVLQKPLASLSDSSDSTSPTLVSSRVKPEISLMLA
ncbi:hypothetical protein GQ457_15G011810 [Hibiscus cannabinus]